MKNRVNERSDRELQYRVTVYEAWVSTIAQVAFTESNIVNVAMGLFRKIEHRSKNIVRLERVRRGQRTIY